MVTETANLVNANFHGEVLSLEERPPLELWHVQIGLKNKGREIRLDAPEVDDVIGREGFPLLLEEVKDVLEANKCSIQLVGPNEAGTMIRFTLSIDLTPPAQ